MRALLHKCHVLLRLCIAAVICFLTTLSLRVFLKEFNLVLQVASSVVSRARLRLFLGNFFGFLLIFGARFAVPHLAFLVTALLLLDIDPSKLVEVVEQRADSVVFHVSSAAYLEWLQVVREVVIDDVDTRLEIDESVV